MQNWQARIRLNEMFIQMDSTSQPAPTKSAEMNEEDNNKQPVSVRAGLSVIDYIYLHKFHRSACTHKMYLEF